MPFLEPGGRIRPRLLPKEAKTTLDSIDRSILELLQADSALSISEIASRVGLTSSPCWRRVQKLEDGGVIRRRVTLLDAKKLNLDVTVFVSIKTNQHSEKWLRDFAAAVASLPEVVEFHRLAGDVDYLLKVVVPSIDAYDGVYKRLIELVDLYDVSSSFSMEEMKYTTALPLSYAAHK